MMLVKLREIGGIAAALADLHITRGKWTPETDARIYGMVETCCTTRGKLVLEIPDYPSVCATLVKHATTGPEPHHTILAPIEIHAIVDGISRGAQDDFDSHAGRLLYIMRQSSRRSSMGELAPWYQDRIASPEELGLELPDVVERNGQQWIHTTNGYVRAEYAGQRDTERGLRRLGDASMFAFGVNLDNLRHIWHERRPGSGAHADVQEMMGLLRAEIVAWQPWIGELLPEVLADEANELATALQMAEDEEQADK